jgi:replicative DNA helicase
MNAPYSSRDFRPALPDAIEAEQALLGAIFIDNSRYWRVAGFLKPHHFREPLHQEIFETAGSMIAEGRAANPITLKPYLRPDQKVFDMTIFEYLVRLATDAPTTLHAYDYGRAIIEMWARHRLISVAQDLDTMARDIPAEMSPQRLISETTGRFVTISNEISEGVKAITMADAVDQAVKAIDDAYAFRKPAGILTGVEAVDQLTGPWEPGQQVIIGGGTKQGKTSLAMQCAVGLASQGPVWIYSGEMSVKQLAMREIARRTGIPVWRQKEGRLSTAERERVRFVRQEVESLPILIEKRRLTLEQIHQIGRELKMERGIASMIIDHVGLLAWGRDDARREEHALSAKATQQLKAIYEDLGIPGVSLVQLKKNTFVPAYGSRPKGFSDRMREAVRLRPKYTDLMGAVERDADHVLIPFNARPLLAALEPEEGSDDYILWEGKMSEHEKKAEIILALSREQTFPQRRNVEWHGETTSFGPSFVGRQETLLPEGF